MKILIEETIRKFGYSPLNLKTYSTEIVLCECPNCKRIFERKFKTARNKGPTQFCFICQNGINARKSIDVKNEKIKKWFETHEHPLKGTKRPAYVIEACRQANLGRKPSKEQKDFLSKKFSGSGNPFFGKHHTEEIYLKMVKRNRQNVRKGKESNFYGKIYHGKGEWYTKLDGTQNWMRSSWEIKYAKYLDVKNILWEYEPKAFEITLNDINCTYRPDFYLVNENKYVEIKGYWRADAKSKFDAFKEQYPDVLIEVYMGRELNAMGII
jgi:hypothetical protein